MVNLSRQFGVLLAFSGMAGVVLPAPAPQLLGLGLGALFLGETGGFGCLWNSGGGCSGGKARLNNQRVMLQDYYNVTGAQVRAYSQASNQMLQATQGVASIVGQGATAVSKQEVTDANTVGQATAAAARSAVALATNAQGTAEAQQAFYANTGMDLAYGFKDTAKYMNNPTAKTSAQYAQEFNSS